MRSIHSSSSAWKQESPNQVKELEEKSKSGELKELNKDEQNLPPQPYPKQFKIGQEKTLGIAGELWGRKAEEEEPAPDGSSYEERFFRTRYDTRYKDIIAAQTFMDTGDKDKETFLEKCEQYQKTITKHKHGQVEFIYGAMTLMKDYGVHKDLTAYKALMDVLSEGSDETTEPISSWVFPFSQAVTVRCGPCCIRWNMRELNQTQTWKNWLLTSSAGRAHRGERLHAKYIGLGSFGMQIRTQYLKISITLPPSNSPRIALKRMCPDLQNTLTVMSVSYFVM